MAQGCVLGPLPQWGQPPAPQTQRQWGYCCHEKRGNWVPNRQKLQMFLQNTNSVPSSLYISFHPLNHAEEETEATDKLVLPPYPLSTISVLSSTVSLWAANRATEEGHS